MNKYLHLLLLLILPIACTTIAIVSLREVWQTVKFYTEKDFVLVDKDQYLFDPDDSSDLIALFVIITGSISAGLHGLYVILLLGAFIANRKVSSGLYSLMLTAPLLGFLLSTASFLLGFGLKDTICYVSCVTVKMFSYEYLPYDTFEGKVKSFEGVGFILMCVVAVVSLIFLIVNSLSLFAFCRAINIEFGENQLSDIESPSSKPKPKPKPKPSTSHKLKPIENKSTSAVNNNSDASIEKLQSDLSQAISLLQNIQNQIPTLIQQQQQKNQNAYQTQQLINLLIQQQIQQMVPLVNNNNNNNNFDFINSNINLQQQIQQQQQLQQQLIQLQQQQQQQQHQQKQQSTSPIIIESQNNQLDNNNNNNMNTPENPPSYKESQEEQQQDSNLEIPETREEKIKSLKKELEIQLQTPGEESCDAKKVESKQE